MVGVKVKVHARSWVNVKCQGEISGTPWLILGVQV